MNALPETMSAVLLTGHGGFDKLDYRTDIRTPGRSRARSSSKSRPLG